MVVVYLYKIKFCSLDKKNKQFEKCYRVIDLSLIIKTKSVDTNLTQA